MKEKSLFEVKSVISLIKVYTGRKIPITFYL